MLIYSCPKIIKYTVIILFFLLVDSFLFAQEPSLDTVSGSSHAESRALTEIQKHARLYRNQGFQLQDIGDLEGALTLYQKALELDPLYAVVYNDLGVIYEVQGWTDRAKEFYLRATMIDPNYLSAYSNLALLYENEGDLDRAALYWEKRVELGSDDDPWTRRAKQHLENICLILGRPSGLEVKDLMKEITAERSLPGQEDKGLAKIYFEKAKQNFQKGEEITALKQAIDAKQLDPYNTDIDDFIERVQRRLLTR